METKMIPRNWFQPIEGILDDCPSLNLRKITKTHTILINNGWYQLCAYIHCQTFQLLFFSGGFKSCNVGFDVQVQLRIVFWGERLCQIELFDFQ
jgi:hypothetical protein